MNDQLFYRRNWITIPTLIFFALIATTTLTGCEDGRILGKDVYFENERCRFTYDDTSVNISCGPLSKIRYADDKTVYFGSINNINRVIDGDTINDVFILLHQYEDDPAPVDLDTWPGIQRRADGLYMVENVRIIGLDAAEVKRSQNYPEAERDLAKARGFIARDYLRSLVAESVIDGVSLSMELVADGRDSHGRVLCDVFLYINNERINVAQRMLETRHGVKYLDGTNFQWGAEPLDFAGWYEMLGIEDPYIRPADGSEHPFEILDESVEDEESDNNEN